MSYELKRDLAFSGESKSLYVVIASFVGLLGFAFLFSEVGVAKYWMVCVAVAILCMAWLVARTFTKVIACESCKDDLRATLMQLGKSSTQGYCPKCGNEIV